MYVFIALSVTGSKRRKSVLKRDGWLLGKVRKVVLTMHGIKTNTAKDTVALTFVLRPSRVQQKLIKFLIPESEKQFSSRQKRKQFGGSPHQQIKTIKTLYVYLFLPVSFSCFISNFFPTNFYLNSNTFFTFFICKLLYKKLLFYFLFLAVYLFCVDNFCNF